VKGLISRSLLRVPKLHVDRDSIDYPSPMPLSSSSTLRCVFQGLMNLVASASKLCYFSCSILKCHGTVFLLYVEKSKVGLIAV